MQPSQSDTINPVGRHFQLLGHVAHRDIRMVPIELIPSKDIFLLRARERFNIVKFQSEKWRDVTEIEHGLNMNKGQD